MSISHLILLHPVFHTNSETNQTFSAYFPNRLQSSLFLDTPRTRRTSRLAKLRDKSEPKRASTRHTRALRVYTTSQKRTRPRCAQASAKGFQGRPPPRRRRRRLREECRSIVKMTREAHRVRAQSNRPAGGDMRPRQETPAKLSR